MKSLKISEIQIIPVKPKNGLVAFTSCVVNDAFYIGNIAIYTSHNYPGGYRLVYPSKFLPNGKEVNCFHPINRDAGEIISNAIISRFKQIISRRT